MAQTLYITDSIEVGLHAKKSLDSAITVLVPSGTALELLANDNALLQVRTPDGASGWVDSAYVQEEPPMRAVAQKLQERVDTLQQSEAALRSEVAVLNERLVTAERIASDADSERTALQAQRAENTTMTPASAAGAAAPVTINGGNERLSEALRDLQALAQENQSLKAELLEAHNRPAPSIAVASSTNAPKAECSNPVRVGGSGMGLLSVPSWNLWEKILLGFVALLAFAAGAYTVDWRIRRRHGGFRI